MVPVQDGAAGGKHQRGGGWSPLSPVLRLLGKLAEGQRLSRKVQERAEAMTGSSQPRSSGTGPSPSSAGATAASPSSPPSGSSDAQAPAAVQYSLQEVPSRRLLAGGTPPQLAWVPLRVALQLLHSVPQHFVVLQSSPFQPPQRQPSSQAGGQPSMQAARGQGKGAGDGAFTSVASPSSLQVHIIPVGPLGAGVGPV